MADIVNWINKGPPIVFPPPFFLSNRSYKAREGHVAPSQPQSRKQKLVRASEKKKIAQRTDWENMSFFSVLSSYLLLLSTLITFLFLHNFYLC